MDHILLTLIVAAIAACVFLAWRRRGERRRGAEYITRYEFAPGLAAKLAEKYPALDDGEIRQVLDGLRQFFLACLAAEGHRVARHVGMPSVAVDEAWHEFILMTRDYQEFCTHAFGRYLHHSPAGQMQEPEEKSLANTLHQLRASSPAPGGGWAMMGAMPLLFALDRQLGIPGGRVFEADEMAKLEEQRRQAAAWQAGGGSPVAFMCGGSTSCHSGSSTGCDSGASSCGGSSCGGSGCGGSS
jgi:hypothetical protein